MSMNQHSDAVAQCLEALRAAGRRVHPNWSAQQIVGAAQNLIPERAAAIKAGRSRAWKRMHEGEGHIYLCEVLGHYPIVKIGYALELDSRMRALPRDHRGYKFRLLKATPGDFTEERHIHSMLFNSRWKGTRHREFYAARTVYESGADLPQGFMVTISAFLGREAAQGAAA